MDVIETNPNHFRAVGLAAHKSVDLMCSQVGKFRPDAVAMTHRESAAEVRSRAGGMTRVFEGLEGLLEMIEMLDAEAVVNGLVGSAGLVPTLTSLRSGKDVYLANKETMVMGGMLVVDTLKKTGRKIVPIDSEMSAIYQCLKGEDHGSVKRLVLTASGGPFKDFSLEELGRVTIAQALKHPTWQMGVKNTIDSATLMNKGLEVIEASMLFGIPGDSIDVTIHETSVVHSLVEFIDGSILCQLSRPDMRLAIQYAMTDPERLVSNYGGLDFSSPFALTFSPPDMVRFPCLALAYKALARKGTATAALNGANEQAVDEFVRGRISFMEIPELDNTVLEEHHFVENPTIDQLIETDTYAKRRITELTV
jgi:1-deoxy-D-xylulose-5-phosphate reductoisomerase